MKQVFLEEVEAGVIERGDMAFDLCCNSVLFQNSDGIQAADDRKAAEGKANGDRFSESEVD